MVIAKYTDNLYASEVYRELERHAVRKGHFEPTDEQRVKLAAQQVNQTLEENKPISAEQTNDLVQDIARLAFAMRRKGYDNHADELEQKLLMYKRAESSLYNVTPETNKDFIGFSHRDGDVEIIEGSGELGTIETIESLAKKIRAITEKEPSGKLPGKSASLQELAEVITKFAQEGDGPKTITEVLNYAKQVIQTFDANRRQRPVDAGSFTFPDIEKNAQAQGAYVYWANGKTTLQAVQRWYQVKAVAEQNGFSAPGASGMSVSQEMIYATIYADRETTFSGAGSSGSFQKILALATAVGDPNLANDAYRGVNNRLEAIVGQGSGNRFEYNPGSIWRERVDYLSRNNAELDEGRAQNLAASLVALAQKIYNAAFGANNSIWDAAKKALQAPVITLYAEIDAIPAGVEFTNTSGALNALVSISTKIGEARKKFTASPRYGYIKNSLSDPSLPDKVVNWLDNQLNKPVHDSYSKVARSDQLKRYTANTKPLQDALAYWRGVAARPNVDEATINQAETTMGNIEKLKGVLEQYGRGDKYWVEVKAALAEIGIEMPNAATLEKQIERLSGTRLPGDRRR